MPVAGDAKRLKNNELSFEPMKIFIICAVICPFLYNYCRNQSQLYEYKYLVCPEGARLPEVKSGVVFQRPISPPKASPVIL